MRQRWMHLLCAHNSSRFQFWTFRTQCKYTDRQTISWSHMLSVCSTCTYTCRCSVTNSNGTPLKGTSGLGGIRTQQAVKSESVSPMLLPLARLSSYARGCKLCPHSFANGVCSCKLVILRFYIGEKRAAQSLIGWPHSSHTARFNQFETFSIHQLILSASEFRVASRLEFGGVYAIKKSGTLLILFCLLFII